MRDRSPVNCERGTSTVSVGRANGRSLWTMTCGSTIPRAVSTSEGYASTELNVSWIVAVLIDDSKSRVARVLIRIPEHRVIEAVDGLDPDLQARSVRDLASLVEPEIEKIEIHAPDLGDRARELPDIVLGLGP